MKKIRFDQDELITVAVFKEKTKQETLDSIKTAMFILETLEDADMYALLLNTYGKLERMSEKEYANMELEDYLMPEEETDEAGE